MQGAGQRKERPQPCRAPPAQMGRLVRADRGRGVGAPRHGGRARSASPEVRRAARGGDGLGAGEPGLGVRGEAWRLEVQGPSAHFPLLAGSSRVTCGQAVGVGEAPTRKVTDAL